MDPWRSLQHGLYYNEMVNFCNGNPHNGGNVTMFDVGDIFVHIPSVISFLNFSLLQAYRQTDFIFGLDIEIIFLSKLYPKANHNSGTF